MARGWESKSVEGQIDEAEVHRHAIPGQIHSPETLELMHAVIRKMAHLTEYFILSFFLMHGLRGKNREWKFRWAISAVVIAAGYASFDEFHQSFVTSRTASPWDALLDTVGASAGQACLWVWYFLRARNSQANTIRRGDSFRL